MGSWEAASEAREAVQRKAALSGEGSLPPAVAKAFASCCAVGADGGAGSLTMMAALFEEAFADLEAACEEEGVGVDPAPVAC